MRPNAPFALDALERLHQRFAASDGLVRTGGRVSSVTATHIMVEGLTRTARLGDVVEHRARAGIRLGEVVQVTADGVMVSPFDRAADAGVGETVTIVGGHALAPDATWRGRAIDALCRPIDGLGPIASGTSDTAKMAPAAMVRQRVDMPFRTGVKVIDIFTPLCYGQRMGVFAGSGVGKSTLLAMLANADAFDTVVVALIGERGREVREFLEDTIGAAMAKTIAIVSTSDESAMMRRRAPETAIGVAEHFRAQGDRVLLLLDSITRYAHALREVAIAAGEPPVARGYPASVFTDLPKLLERAGPGPAGEGSITAILSVLIDGDDHNDPVADAARGILDGHVVLERTIAEQGRYPPVDPLASISRLSSKAWSPDERKLVAMLKALIARFEDTRDIRLLGGYQPGADPELDQAVRQVPLVYAALAQSPHDGPSKDPFADLAAGLKPKEQTGAPAAN